MLFKHERRNFRGGIRTSVRHAHGHDDSMLHDFMPHALLEIGVPTERGGQPLTVQLEVSCIAGTQSTSQRQKEPQEDSFQLQD